MISRISHGPKPNRLSPLHNIPHSLSLLSVVADAPLSDYAFFSSHSIASRGETDSNHLPIDPSPSWLALYSHRRSSHFCDLRRFTSSRAP